VSDRNPVTPHYGLPDDISARQWREAHVDPSNVRAWCTQTGRPVPRGTIPQDLIDAYLAERAHEIPLPGHPTRDEAHEALPILATQYNTWLGPIQVTFGPCPVCRRPTCALPGQRLPPCLYCQTSPAARTAP
jgi:hypothetical protein